MGDPKKSRRQYRSPSHPWIKSRLEEEDVLAREYGIKNKKEIWKMESVVSGFTMHCKKLFTNFTNQGEKEKSDLIKKLKSLGLLKESQGFDDILSLTTKDIMERRLQTIVHRKGLAKTMKQSRQMITHNHVMIGDKKITSPSYIVKVSEEAKLSFSPKSSFSSPDHPERVVREKSKKRRERKPKPRMDKRRGRK